MKFGYTIIYVSDVVSTVKFYERAFGIPSRFIHESGQYAELETGATTLAFAEENLARGSCHDFRLNRSSEIPAGAEVGFVVNDVQAAFDHAVIEGALPVVKPMQKPWGQTVSYVRDLNGFFVEICSAVIMS